MSIEPSAGATGQPSRRLAAIMFTDLVGYSALAHRDEKLAIELLELHRGWVREILPQHGGIEIETVGDAFLVEFSGALAAVECALAIQRRFGEYNQAAKQDRQMQLRIGIHLGDIEHKGGKVMGDGVNIASRIHGMARPGGICVSENVYHVVRNRAGLQLTSIGTPELKNIGTRLELFAIEGGATAAPAAKRRGNGQRLAGAIVGATLLALAAIAFVALRRPGDAPVAAEPATVAVLPFTNMSADRDNEYFADGMHETLLANLSRIGNLRVISRTSVMEYKNVARNLRQLGKALGVAHIVEGSVQRQGSRVRITAQLIRVSDDQHLWAESYDRDIADVFAIQSDVAQKIAGSVQARLTAREKSQIEVRPTQSPEAYELHLRAQYEWKFSASSGLETAQRVLALYERAIALDPTFALAFARASEVHGQFYWYDIDRTPARMEKVLSMAQRALELSPDLKEGKLALGYYYRLRRDYARAYEIYSELAEVSPNDADVLSSLAFVERRQGRFAAAAEHLRRAIEGDPLNVQLHLTLAEVLILSRDYAAAERVLDRSVDVPGNSARNDLVIRTSVAIIRDGDMSAVEALLPHLVAQPDSGDRTFYRYVYHFWSGRHDEAIQVSQAWPLDMMPMINVAFGANFTYSKAYLIAQAYRAKGDRAAAETHFRQARTVLTAELARRPDDARLLAGLGVTLAALGDAAGARAAAQKAGELMPISRDALVGPAVAQLAAQTYAWLGDRDAAIGILEDLLKGPTHVTSAALRLNPVWQPLRADPRFQRLIAPVAAGT